MAGVYDNVPGAVEFENDGEIELLGVGPYVAMVEAQEAAAAAGTYEGYSFVGLPV